MPRGKTMYTVKDLIKHLKWANPDATVSALIDGEHQYLSMDGASQDNELLIFAPRCEFDDIRVYLKCPKCGYTTLEHPTHICHRFGCDGELDIINKDYDEDKIDKKTALYRLTWL